MNGPEETTLKKKSKEKNFTETLRGKFFKG